MNPMNESNKEQSEDQQHDSGVKEKHEKRKSRQRRLSNVSLDPSLFRKLTNTKRSRESGNSSSRTDHHSSNSNNDNSHDDNANSNEKEDTTTREESTKYDSLRSQEQNENSVDAQNMIDIRNIEPYITQLLEQKQLLSEELKENQDTNEDLKHRNDELTNLVNDYQRHICMKSKL
ncbi:hypothetical protein RFI_21540, partial [Reticulomyxa filosa]